MTEIILMTLHFYLLAQFVLDFSITSIMVVKVALAPFKDKKILIFNTAANCGNHTQYIDVKGQEMSPLFHYLTNQDNPDFKGEIKWNFEKFLIDENGKLVRRYRSAVTPLDKAITDQI